MKEDNRNWIVISVLTGWVVGSLELIGNPTGLVRSLGVGVADLFRLPLHGLTQGPGAFVGGITNGLGSLVKNVSSGKLLVLLCNFLKFVDTLLKLNLKLKINFFQGL